MSEKDRDPGRRGECGTPPPWLISTGSLRLISRSGCPVFLRLALAGWGGKAPEVVRTPTWLCIVHRNDNDRRQTGDPAPGLPAGYPGR